MSAAMHHVGGGDRPMPAPLNVTWSPPKPKPTGLDWTKHTTPEPAQPTVIREEATVTQIRDRLTTPRTITGPEAKQIVADYTNGATIKGLCRTHSRTSDTIYAALRGADVTLRGNQGRAGTNTTHPDTIAEIIRLYTTEKLTRATIAAQVGVSAPTVSKYLTQAAVPPNPRGVRPGTKRAPYRNRTAIDQAEAIRQYQAGETIPTIAANNAWPIASLRRVLTGSGIELRDDRKGHTGGRNAYEYRRPELINQIRHLYLEERYSQARIARQLGIAMNSVKRIMTAHDIPARERQSGSGDTLGRYRDRMTALGVTTAQVKTWATTHGLPVPLRGLVTGDVLTVYEKEHQTPPTTPSQSNQDTTHQQKGTTP